jgi:glycosyltransferase involved in cell wall biosynthesis
MPAVGVIMSTHGQNPYLATAVESVIAQSLPDWTLNIVCDGSTKETVRVAESFAARDKRVRVLRQARAGVAIARNRGLEELGPRVELVAFLDHDDRWLPGALDALTRTLGSGSDLCVGAHGIARFVDESGVLVRPGELEQDLRRRRGVERGRLGDWPIERHTTFANLAFSNCIPVGTVLIRRAAFDRIGGFDERAVPADDYDMWLRLARLGDFAFVDEVVMEYRQHASPTWVRPRGIGRGAPYVRRKAITCADNTTAQATQAREGFRLCEKEIIGHALSEVVRLVVGKRYRDAARQLLRASVHLGGFTLRRPGPWHE